MSIGMRNLMVFYKREIADTLLRLRLLIAESSLDVSASMVFLDSLPAWIVDHFATDIAVLQNSLVGVPLGGDRHQAVARYHLARLLVQFEALAVKTSRS